jgi:DEAD/DEAH box helicase domain-containing protein
VLRERGGRYYWIGRRRAAAAVSLRSSGGHPFRIVDVDTGAVVGDADEPRVYRQNHPGAIYLHQGRTFDVVELDLDQRVAGVRDATGVDHTTRATTATDVRVLGVTEQRDLGPVRVAFGRTRVTEEVTGYDVLEPTSRRVLDHVELDLPPTRLTTVAVWWSLTRDALTAARIDPQRARRQQHAAEHAAIGLLPLIALCDRWDLGGLSTTDHPDTGEPTVFIYDGIPGGAGLTERSYRRLEEHLTATREAITSCRCRDGCPSCVQSPKCGNGNEPLDKAGAADVLGLVLAAITDRRPTADGRR